MFAGASSLVFSRFTKMAGRVVSERHSRFFFQKLLLEARAGEALCLKLIVLTAQRWFKLDLSS